LNVDTIGPLPSDENGNNFIIVVVDCFTRFVELYPSKSTDAKSAAQAVLSVVGRFGCPTQILSDAGTQYCNELMTELYNIIGVEQLVTLAGSKEENTIVERSIKEIMRHMRGIIFHEKSLVCRYAKFTKRITKYSKTESNHKRFRPYSII
jgi:transposase InsO family protein